MSFNITNFELAQIIKNTNGFIAGGFALGCFLSNGLNKLNDCSQQINELFDCPIEQDIDIFIKSPYTYEKVRSDINIGVGNSTNSNNIPFELLAIQYIDSILKTKNYSKNDLNMDVSIRMNLSWRNKDLEEIEYHKSALSHYIKNITTWKNEYGRKIQVIILYNCLIVDFIQTFDLSICKIGICWDYVKNKFEYYHKITEYLDANDLYLIKNKKFYICNPLYPSNLEKRIMKYIQRGFTFTKPDGEPIFNNDDIIQSEVNKYIIDNFENKIISWEEFKENKYNNKLKNIMQNYLGDYIPF
jgi:hypothetical protein